MLMHRKACLIPLLIHTSSLFDKTFHNNKMALIIMSDFISLPVALLINPLYIMPQVNLNDYQRMYFMDHLDSKECFEQMFDVNN